MNASYHLLGGDDMEMFVNVIQIVFISLVGLYAVYSEVMFIIFLTKIIRASCNENYAAKQPALWKEHYTIDCFLYFTMLWLPIKLSEM